MNSSSLRAAASRSTCNVSMACSAVDRKVAGNDQRGRDQVELVPPTLHDEVRRLLELALAVRERSRAVGRHRTILPPPRDRHRPAWSRSSSPSGTGRGRRDRAAASPRIGRRRSSDRVSMMAFGSVSRVEIQEAVHVRFAPFARDTLDQPSVKLEVFVIEDGGLDLSGFRCGRRSSPRARHPRTARPARPERQSSTRPTRRCPGAGCRRAGGRRGRACPRVRSNRCSAAG